MTDNLGAKAVARATGVSTDTLRHYERKGLLPRVHRTAAGHRRYSSTTVERVLLIQRALVVGFSLNDLSRAVGDGRARSQQTAATNRGQVSAVLQQNGPGVARTTRGAINCSSMRTHTTRTTACHHFRVCFSILT